MGHEPRFPLTQDAPLNDFSRLIKLSLTVSVCAEDAFVSSVCVNVLSVVTRCLSQMQSIRVVYCDGNCHKCMREIYIISFLYQSILHGLLLLCPVWRLIEAAALRKYFFRWLFSTLIHWKLCQWKHEVGIKWKFTVFTF